MRYLVIVRHGDHDEDRGQFLTEKGRGEIEKLCNNLTRYFAKNASVKILSSPEMRAIRSASLISQTLNIPFWRGGDTSSFLFSKENFQDSQLNDIRKLVEVEKEKCDVLILVTHLEICERFPEFVLRKKYGSSPTVRRCGSGEGVLLDLEAIFPQSALNFI